ncbi:hypothetical protein [Actinoplanes couchii]|uniref:Tat pathway signal sequence domain protein n=1 Tax=Actinoplanes couchii TaxID=403638 RepID=A0ABQ3XDS8_9ACTN|nr:hypothetical protein [Actinoplanes couchii]MDR6317136.1 hypothetical protein [Actinoplanes couchii]GID56630.1 hypothetical protein Aco03nite_050340 [Actinoplanes couchii]
MSRSKKRLAVIGAGVGTAALVVGGVAFAAFQQSAQATTTGTTAAEAFAPLSVSGEWAGRRASDGTYPPGNLRLLPGEAGDVRIKLTNPATNTVQGRVVEIKPVASALTSTCAGSFVVSTYVPAANAVVIKNDGNGIDVILRDAVTLKPETTSACQGATYPTKFEVKFEATRANVTAPGFLTPFNAKAAAVDSTDTAKAADPDTAAPAS